MKQKQKNLEDTQQNPNHVCYYEGVEEQQQLVGERKAASTERESWNNLSNLLENDPKYSVTPRLWEKGI